MAPGLDHLLRTLAPVPPGTRVLCRGEAAGEAARALSQLGFEVHDQEASGGFGWAAVWLSAPNAETLWSVRSALAPGGWAWVAASGVMPEALMALAAEAGLALAERPLADGGIARGVFRRVDAGVRA